MREIQIMSTVRNWRDAPTQFVDIGGVRLAYRRLGPDQGVPLVMLNHWGANLDNFDPPIVDALAADRPVCAPFNHADFIFHQEVMMPVFNAHIPAGRFSSQQKRALGDALNQSLVQALGVPEGDRFVILSEHRPDELFLHPTFMDMERDPASAMIITVLVGAHRPLEDKSKLVAAINRLVVEAVAVSPDDIFIALIPVPNENFSFGRGELQLAESGPKW